MRVQAFGALVGLSLLVVTCTASAQTVADTNDADQSSRSKGAGKQDLEEIVVTGTLIRGVAPGGANLIELTHADVEVTGATSTAQLLDNIPQLGSFNGLQVPTSGGFNTVTTNRPNLRNLPGFLTSGSASTLILVDGHRLVGMGVTTTTPDPDIVPPGMIERVEIVPDGGSAIYGSDAVAGVINFITRKNFDGVELAGHYGRAADYGTADMNLTAGHSWGSGSAYISYNFSRHDALNGYDRGYVNMPQTTIAGIPFPVRSLKCSPGNVQNLLTGTVYALPFTTGHAVPNTANQCDESDPSSFVPWEHRNAVFGGVSQELSDSSKLDVTAYFMDRKVESGDEASSITEYIGPAFFGLTPSPFQAAHSITGSPFEIQAVNLQLARPVTGAVHLQTWGFAPTFTADLGAGWQLRALASYGQSRTSQDTLDFSSTALTNATAVGLFNPYDPASSDPRGLMAVQDFDAFGYVRQRLINARVVVDGDLMTLPGGALKLATGVEYNQEKFVSQTGQVVTGTQNTGYAGLTVNGTVIAPATPAVPIIDLQRNIKAAFAELAIPIVGKDNRMTGMEELSLSASGRFDDYSDVGSTFNPKFGLTYKPLEWVKLRGDWGKSFVAPSLADNQASTATNFNWVQGLSFLLPPASLIASGKYPAPKPGQNVIVMLGNAPNIQPQKAQTWSVGFDLTPPVAPGLKLSLTYWNIKYNDVIALPDFVNQINFYTNFGKFITTNPTLAQINAFTNISQTVAGLPCGPLPGCVYDIIDARKTNLGDFNLNGLDFDPTYTLPTSFGSLNFGINADYELSRKQSPIAGAPFADLLENNNSRFRGRVTAGAQVQKLHAEVNLNHTQGYSLYPAVGVAPQQTHVASFDVMNLFFRYDIDGIPTLKNLGVTLNVDNVMDRAPPQYRQQSINPSADGFANGLTIGRLVQLGFDAKF